MSTKIEWCEETWNPVTGCTKVSEGCQNCYAERMAKRLAGRFGYPKDDPFKVTFHSDRLDQPFKWKKPRLIFVVSMGDLFHKNVKVEFFWEIIRVFLETPQHTYLLLTKRPERMKAFVKLLDIFFEQCLKNLWLGVSVENQRTADERIPILLEIPAAVRFVSVEPQIEFISLGKWIDKLDWIICGSESGQYRRPSKRFWVEFLRDQCVEAGVPFFMKQLQINGKIEHDIDKFPKDLQIRQYPKITNEVNKEI